jgi:hypothetical protein
MGSQSYRLPNEVHLRLWEAASGMPVPNETDLEFAPLSPRMVNSVLTLLDSLMTSYDSFAEVWRLC